MAAIVTDNAGQYGDSRKLAARARLHSQYSVAETGWFPWVAGQLPLRTGDHVLDIGCGPGWFWAAAVDQLPQALALTLADLSPGMVDEALRRCAPLPFGALRGEAADATVLPFVDDAFDAVVAMHMLYHLPDPGAAIAEMARVLKPGGYLAVTTNDIGNLRALHELTAVFGSDPVDPAGAAFGFEDAENLLRAQFGEVSFARHPARLRITEPDDVFLALTSYPPGDKASQAQLARFREAIEAAFARGNGVLEADKQIGLFLSRKARG
ncbi:class I SAM-dependent methyltransferase [Bosea sp. LC85]|uniref:class I SAM-dependent methyltransferase n=1 Tax=Bosea sp. LC85 TaxID=1502851 RepID=UPI0005BA41A1|nr:class I SAM-dependent methyltransferase [Bosea sp. LC85]